MMRERENVKQLKSDLLLISKEIDGVKKDTEILMKAVLRSLKVLSKKTERVVKAVNKLEKGMIAEKRTVKARKK
jgi:hypothetical protein